MSVIKDLNKVLRHSKSIVNIEVGDIGLPLDAGDERSSPDPMEILYDRYFAQPVRLKRIFLEE